MLRSTCLLKGSTPRKMTNDEKLVAEIKRDEGSVPHVYQDSLGWWTIGVGRLVDKRKGGKLSPEEIDFLLMNDIDAKVAEMDRLMPWWRELDSVVRQRVLINMAFNLGVVGLLKFKNTLVMVQSGNYEGAAKGMLASLWAKQVGNRAVRLAEMMRKGDTYDVDS